MGALFGIYVHWPFCASKCPYCDFNSHVAQTIDHDAWAEAYLKEIDYYAAKTPGRLVTSIFFGGGTPSLMKPATVQKVIDRITQRWHIANDIEITLEANPTSVEIGKFADFRIAGVNRVSIGVQALNNDDLKFLGREHDAGEARAAIDIAAKTFDRYSFDLIYARPNQTPDAWNKELSEALAMGTSHLSLYQLTIEQGTPFYMRHERGEFKIPDEDVGGELYDITQERLEAAGMPAYEVSNHAKPGQESLHNLTYWRYGDYAGIGPGAHGRLTIDGHKYATRGHRAPDIWMDRVAGYGHGGHPDEPINRDQRVTEAVMMGLRLKEGLCLASLEAEAGKDWREIFDEKKIAALAQEGLVVLENDRLIPTCDGLARLNGLLAYLL